MTHFDFTDKTVIITGAASGIGAAQAAAFQAAGATVVGIDLQPISNLTDAIQADVSDPATAAAIAAQYQPDIVCNTAGVLMVIKL